MRECEEMVVSSITIAFPIRLNGSIATRDPILVSGRIQQFGPIVQSFPMMTGPEITVFGPNSCAFANMDRAVNRGMTAGRAFPVPRKMFEEALVQLTDPKGRSRPASHQQ